MSTIQAAVYDAAYPLRASHYASIHQPSPAWPFLHPSISRVPTSTAITFLPSIVAVWLRPPCTPAFLLAVWRCALFISRSEMLSREHTPLQFSIHGWWCALSLPRFRTEVQS